MGLLGRIAQLVRALPLQGRGHRFDPCSAYHEIIYDVTFGAVVQPGLGRQIVNLEVAGSNPVGPAIFYSVRGQMVLERQSEKVRRPCAD